MNPIHLFAIFALPGAVQGLAVHFLADRFGQGDSDLIIVTLSIFAFIAPIVHHLTTSANKRFSPVVISVVLGALSAGLSYWTLSRFAGAHWQVDMGIGPLAMVVLCSMLISFIALPFYQARVIKGESLFHYPSLFEHAWGQSVCLLIAGLFTLLVFMVTGLSVALFDVLGFSLHEIIYRGEVLLPILGAAFGLSVGIARERESIVHSTRLVLLALLRALLPIFALVTALFLVTALVTGVANIDTHFSVTFLLITSICVSITLCNGAVQDETDVLQGHWSWIVRFQSLILPFMAALTAYGLWIRISEYGLTHLRVLALIITALVSLYALGYGLAAVVRSTGRLIQRINILLAMTLLVTATLLMTPVLDIYQIAVRTQVASLVGGRSDLDTFDFEYLKFATGLAGKRALDDLKTIDTANRAELDVALAEVDKLVKPIRFGSKKNADFASEFEDMLSRDLIQLYQPESDPHFNELLKLPAFSDRVRFRCAEPESQCVVYQTTDFQLPSMQYLIATSTVPGELNIFLVYKNDENEWQSLQEPDHYWDAQSIILPPDDIKTFLDNLKNGKLETQTVRVQALKMGNTLHVPAGLGNHIEVHEERE